MKIEYPFPSKTENLLLELIDKQDKSPDKKVHAYKAIHERKKRIFEDCEPPDEGVSCSRKLDSKSVRELCRDGDVEVFAFFFRSESRLIRDIDKYCRDTKKNIEDCKDGEEFKYVLLTDKKTNILKKIRKRAKKGKGVEIAAVVVNNQGLGRGERLKNKIQNIEDERKKKVSDERKQYERRKEIIKWIRWIITILIMIVVGGGGGTIVFMPPHIIIFFIFLLYCIFAS